MVRKSGKTEKNYKSLVKIMVFEKVRKFFLNASVFDSSNLPYSL